EHLSGFLDHADRTIAEAALMSIIEILSRNGDIADWELPLDRFTDFLFDGIRSKNRTITRFTLNRLPHWHGPDVIGGLIDAMGAVDEEDVDTIAAVLKEIGPSASPVILDKFKQATTPVKMALLDILKTVIDAEVTHRLLTFFDDPDPEIRRKIAHVIGMSGHAFCIPALRKLAADPVGHVRSAAFGALGWLATESDIDFLCAGLDDRYPDVREAAVGALILVGGTKVIDRFRADLEHRSVERQRLAVLGLGLIGDREVVPSLLKAVNHQEAAIRKSAINSLVRIGQVEDVGPLLLALNDENGGVRKAAISAAVSLLGERAIQEIRALLEDEDVWVRYLAINGIGEVGKHEYGGYIMPYLHDEQDIIKIAAVKALAQMGYQKAVPELKRLREQKNRDVADAAEAALTTIGGIT
ncbi:MAG: HEAT repeat domain-containing protein, partial [candidate division Zixibacteria bacterium]|nr:HEAT repeat domain-containing protein [candidate division Zixibacteria bacterium]